MSMTEERSILFGGNYTETRDKNYQENLAFGSPKTLTVSFSFNQKFLVLRTDKILNYLLPY